MYIYKPDLGNRPYFHMDYNINFRKKHYFISNVQCIVLVIVFLIFYVLSLVHKQMYWIQTKPFLKVPTFECVKCNIQMLILHYVMECVGNLCGSCPLHEQQKGEYIFRLYIIQLSYNGLTSRGANFHKFHKCDWLCENLPC